MRLPSLPSLAALRGLTRPDSCSHLFTQLTRLQEGSRRYRHGAPRARCHFYPHHGHRGLLPRSPPCLADPGAREQSRVTDRRQSDVLDLQNNILVYALIILIVGVPVGLPVVSESEMFGSQTARPY